MPPEFRDLPALIASHAQRQPARDAVVDGTRRIGYAGFHALVNRVAAALQHEGCGVGEVVAVCALSSIEYLAVFIGALRAGLVVAPLAPSSTAAQLAGMAQDAAARIVFVDTPAEALGVAWPARTLRLDTPAFEAWLAPPGQAPQPVAIQPEWPFNIIYSSGTTGTPKGIVQSHAMRWGHIQRAASAGYGPGSVTLIATPLYSNTTLVSVVPSLAHGGSVVLCPKFDAAEYLRLAEAERATHTMLVPVQYQRLLARPDFDRFDLSALRYKFSTSAPFHAELKAEVLRRWPGALVEYYGMTEGGGTCILHAHLFPHKLHTVGQPAEGHEVRLIDEQGCEITPKTNGASECSGEVVGRSMAMMTGYHGQPGKTAEAEWFDDEGRRYIRTGDIGRFDDDGFLILHDRRKDIVISGGFNVYPSDLEAVLCRHPAVLDAAVIGVPSAEWGETPVAYVVTREVVDAEALRGWANQQLGKTQRLSALRVIDELPRNAIGKVLKRALRERWPS